MIKNSVIITETTEPLDTNNAFCSKEYSSCLVVTLRVFFILPTPFMNLIPNICTEKYPYDSPNRNWVGNNEIHLPGMKKSWFLWETQLFLLSRNQVDQRYELPIAQKQVLPCQILPQV